MVLQQVYTTHVRGVADLEGRYHFVRGINVSSLCCLVHLKIKTNECRNSTPRFRSQEKWKRVFTETPPPTVTKTNCAERNIGGLFISENNANVYLLMNGWAKSGTSKRILFSHKKEWSSHTCYDMDEHWNHFTQRNKPITKNPIF